MSLTNVAENALLRHIFSVSSYTPSALEVALSKADPTEDGSGFDEATYPAYVRKSITFDAPANRAVAQSSLIQFPKATGGDETFTHYAIFDSSNMIAYGALTSPINVVLDSTPSIAAGAIIINVVAGMSDYLAHASLDFLFRQGSLIQPSFYLGLLDTVADGSENGTTASEPSGNNYSRTLVSDWTISANSATNTNLIELPNPSGSWGQITSLAIFTAATDGQMLFYDNSVVDQTIGLNDDVKLNPGYLAINLD